MIDYLIIPPIPCHLSLFVYGTREVTIDKLSAFKSYLSHFLHSIFCIVESWCSLSVLDSELIIPGFSVFRRDRLSTCGGGVLLIIRNTFSARRVSTSPTVS